MATIPLDPLFANQWHLRNTTDGLLDLNVVDVWDDYTGAGVQVAIIDDAVQRTHRDLDGNYSIVKDWDFHDNDTNASGVNGNNHGTAVAGIIGAEEGNGIGGVGVAYGSTIFGFRGLSFQNITDAINNASGLQQQVEGGLPRNREADVVNISLGTPGIFTDRENIRTFSALNTAIDNAVIFGRSGLGTILVKSAGNSRAINQDTNASSWNANPHTISVAAVDQNGFVSDYSTHGASVLVSAFGTPGQVVTTDRVGSAGYNSGNYTFGFNGTSAAAPMVSGVVALMLEANPNLGWRDVQEILAYSARHVGTNVGFGTSGDEEYAWTFNGANNWNGGGLHFSNDYGFGLVDAKAAVRLAETWGNIPQTSANDTTVFRDFLNTSTTINIGNNGTGGTSFSRFIGSNIEIEHVEVDVSFTQWHDLGDLEIRLISPDGTSSILIDNSGENGGSAAGGFGSGRWEFFSNEFRGEDTIGTWTVQLFDTDSNTISPITINDIDITFSGKTVSNNDTFIFTEEYSDYDGLFGHTRAINGGIGTDTINAAAVDSNTTINLATGTGLIDGVAIAISGIENVFTGDGYDWIIGNSLNNRLMGMRGNDTLRGENGNDYIDGGSGHDRMYGGSGNDRYIVNSIYDRVTEYSNQGIDRVYSSVNYTLGANVENLTLTGTAYRGYGNTLSNRISGNNSNNYLWGNSGNDYLYGNGGNDTLSGGSGHDRMYGGTGNDSYYVDSIYDRVTEYSNQGIDRIYSSVNYTLGANVENLTLTGTAYRGYGNILNNSISGNNSNNYLWGNSGNDYLYGNGGNDTLSGGSGHDYLNGGSGNDYMYGGSGSDRYIVNSIYDRVTEYSNQGIDQVYSSVNYTLGTNVENLTLTGTAYRGYGNILNNSISGNNSNNYLWGNSGNDYLYGNGGNDTLSGGSGHDYLNGGSGNDYMYGGSGQRSLHSQ